MSSWPGCPQLDSAMVSHIILVSNVAYIVIYIYYILHSYYMLVYMYYHILPRYFSSALQRVDLQGLPHQPWMVTKQIHKLEKTMDRTNDNTCRLFRKIHATSITSLEGLITLPLIFYPSNCRKSA